MNEEKITAGGFFHTNEFKLPKPVYYVMFSGTNTTFFAVNEPAKYPNFWYRFWMKVLLGWVVKKV